MPVKVKPAAVTEVSPKGNAPLDAATLKQIQKLALPLARKAAAMKQAHESAEKTTFELYADFREIARKHFDDNPKAIRQLAVTILASVYDVPLTAVRLDGTDQSRFVYPEIYTNEKGKEVAHPKAGEEIDMEKASDKVKAIAVHPAVKGAASLYQRASRLLKVAKPVDEKAKALVDEALDEDGTCLCTEPQLYLLATGGSREIQPKGSHGGKRDVKVWDIKAITEEARKLVSKGWNGGDLLNGYKGTNDLEELAEAFAAVIAEAQAELDKAERAQAKAAKKGGKAAPEDEDETED